jgi:adenine/guanine/hypoxanthine permease
MCLVSAKNAGDPYPVRETMISDGIGTMLSSMMGSPFGTVIYIGHPAHKRSGALVGYSVVNGCCYLILSWFGVLALVQSLVNQATIGPIVLFVGLMCNEDAINYMPPRHYAAYIVGLFPS